MPSSVYASRSLNIFVRGRRANANVVDAFGAHHPVQPGVELLDTFALLDRSADFRRQVVTELPQQAEQGFLPSADRPCLHRFTPHLSRTPSSWVASPMPTSRIRRAPTTRRNHLSSCSTLLHPLTVARTSAGSSSFNCSSRRSNVSCRARIASSL